MLLGKTLNSYIASPHQEYIKWVLANYWGNLTNHYGGAPSDGLAERGVEILPDAACDRNRDKLQQL